MWRCASDAGRGVKTVEDTSIFSFPFWSHLSVCGSILLRILITVFLPLAGFHLSNPNTSSF